MAVSVELTSGYQLQRLFEECGRDNSFSCLGFDALYNYLYDLSEDCGQDFHVDVVAIDCDFTEYESWEELYDNYSYSYNNEEKTFEQLEEDNEVEDFKQWLYDRTIVINVTNYKGVTVGVIIQNF